MSFDPIQIEVKPKRFTFEIEKNPKWVSITFKNKSRYDISLTLRPKNGGGFEHDYHLCAPSNQEVVRVNVNDWVPASPTVSQLQFEISTHELVPKKFTKSVTINWVQRNNQELELPDWCKCGICCNPFDEDFRAPRVLECGHTFCHQCIARFLEDSRSKVCVKCPDCRRLTRVPQQNVANVPKNFAAIDIIKVISEPTKKKQKVQADEEQEQQLPPCPRHPKNQAEYFCEDDKCHYKVTKEICPTCLSEDHKDHVVEFLFEYLFSSKAHLEPMIDQVNGKIEKVDELLANRRLHLETHNPNGPSLQKQAITEFNDNLKNESIRDFEQFEKTLEEVLKKAKKELMIATSADNSNL